MQSRCNPMLLHHVYKGKVGPIVFNFQCKWWEWW